MDNAESRSPTKPIFLITHTRAISTAFERIFLTREKDIVCVHEPFSDAYHWGPEKLTERYLDVERLREEKGLQHYTYRAAFKVIDDANKDADKRVFVKDMGKCLFTLHGEIPYIVPSLRSKTTKPVNGTSTSHSARHSSSSSSTTTRMVTPINPTVIPPDYLSTFHYAFLIRNPRHAIPSLYECTIPPRSHTTQWHGFKPEDAGYKEIRRLLDYLMSIGQIGPGTDNEICLVDAEDLLAHPRETLQRFCTSVGISFDPESLQWASSKDRARAEATFKNWAPFHDEVLKSTGLKAQKPASSNNYEILFPPPTSLFFFSPSSNVTTTPEADMIKWTNKYGKEAAELIQKNVDDNMDHYLYLKQFAMRVNGFRA